MVNRNVFIHCKKVILLFIQVIFRPNYTSYKYLMQARVMGHILLYVNIISDTVVFEHFLKNLIMGVRRPHMTNHLLVL